MSADAPAVVLWSDYVGPYAFVAKASAYALEDDYEIALHWRPYALDAAGLKHLKALRWRTSYQAICDAWTKDKSIFKINPRHLIPGPHT